MTYVGVPIRNPITGTWVFHIARRFTSPNGEYLGAVLAVVTLQSFEKIFEAIAPTPNSTIVLARRDGTLLARWPHLETALGRPVPDRELFETLLSQSDQATVRRIGVYDGKDRLVSGASFFSVRDRSEEGCAVKTCNSIRPSTIWRRAL